MSVTGTFTRPKCSFLATNTGESCVKKKDSDEETHIHCFSVVEDL